MSSPLLIRRVQRFGQVAWKRRQEPTEEGQGQGQGSRQGQGPRFVVVAKVIPTAGEEEFTDLLPSHYEGAGAPGGFEH